MKTLHIIGGGLAGLATAVFAAKAGRRVALYEATGHAGGRCRSWEDKQLGADIDNGSHLLLGANRHALNYLQLTGGIHTLKRPPQPEFPFLDVARNERFVLQPGGLWFLSKARRVPGTTPADYLKLLPLLFARSGTVADYCKKGSPLYDALLEPLVLAIMNTPVEEASAALFGGVLRRLFFGSKDHLMPLVPQENLHSTFVQPALDYLKNNGADIHFQRGLKSIEHINGRATALVFADATVRLADDSVVLATPFAITQSFLGGTYPEATHGITSIHFLYNAAHLPPLVGILHGVSHWIFARERVLSATISSADTVVQLDDEQLAHAVWQEICVLLHLPACLPPPHRIIHEKRATFAATPENETRRPGTRTQLSNVFLAGDYTNTKLPSTMEGAILSGRKAALLA